jgi:phage gp36-like protein
MSYATLPDMIGRFGEEELIRLTDRDRTAGAVVEDVLDRALADADGEINGYLAVRYALPLPSVPVMLVQIACDIARYYLYDDQATEQVRQRYEDAISRLKGIVKGLVNLALPAPESTVEDDLVEFSSDRQVFRGGGF